MPRAFLAALPAVLFSTLTHATPASGETILIRQGGVGFDTGTPPALTLSGDGFSLMSLFPAIANVVCGVPACTPGALISPSTVFGGESRDFDLGSGIATVGEQTYGTNMGFPGSVVFRGTLSLDADPVRIADGDLFVRLTAPFLLTGTIAGFQTPIATSPLFDVDVFGSGAVTLLLMRDPSRGVYHFHGIDYQFQDPVPEPGALLLVGTGVAGLLVRRRARGRGRRNGTQLRDTDGTSLGQ